MSNSHIIVTAARFFVIFFFSNIRQLILYSDGGWTYLMQKMVNLRFYNEILTTRISFMFMQIPAQESTGLLIILLYRELLPNNATYLLFEDINIESLSSVSERSLQLHAKDEPALKDSIPCCNSCILALKTCKAARNTA
jgi:hypothetical protein